MDRVRIRVTKDGPLTNRALVTETFQIPDLSYADVCDLISQAFAYVRNGRTAEPCLKCQGEVVELSFVEALDFIAQATSSLRW